VGKDCNRASPSKEKKAPEAHACSALSFFSPLYMISLFEIIKNTGNCKNISLWNSNCENDSLFRTLQKWSTFFKPKERAGTIPLRALNSV
jgi:hypothetical protein